MFHTTQTNITRPVKLKLKKYLERTTNNISNFNSTSAQLNSHKNSSELETDKFDYPTPGTLLSTIASTIKLNPIRPTPRGLVDITYVHDPMIREPCNFNNCKLGKCLFNNTCECVYPAVGQYCDQIDECSMLNCKNV